MNKRIVITGGNGFIGGSLVGLLLRQGLKNILVVDRRMNVDIAVEQVQGDFSDKVFMESILLKDDIVCHFACTTIPSTSEANMAADVIENVAGTINLLEVCAANQVDKIIYLSSGGTVYGKADLGRSSRELDETNPMSAHGIMKITVEKYIHHFKAISGLAYCIIRASNPYGRQMNTMRPQGIVDVALYKAVNAEPLELWGDGEVVRDFFHIDDLVELLALIIKSPIADVVVNAGSSQPISVNKMIEVVREVTGRNLVVNRQPARGFDLAYSGLDISLAKKLYDWEPKIGLKEGLIKTFEKCYENPLRHN
jgi:UDP-glucose 4-epimerase